MSGEVILSKFSIKDLENLSNIKAHTIRIWEKRYGLLEPARTQSNIRYYDDNSFKKLLNVSFLNANGFKISKIAGLTDEQIEEEVLKLAEVKSDYSFQIGQLKTAFLALDESRFSRILNELIEELGFEKAFSDVVFSLLNNIGLEWQSNLITPAHEHFTSCLIRQRLLLEIAKLPSVYEGNPCFLYLPDHEFHDIGLLFAYYGLKKKGVRCVYLGPSLPMDVLANLETNGDDCSFVSNFTVHPKTDNVKDYFNKMTETVLNKGNRKLYVSGYNVKDHVSDHKNIETFDTLTALIENVSQ